MQGPLAGCRVLELAHIMAGPVAGMMLADMGADVVKIEKTGGDDTRRMVPPEIEGESAAFMMMNRNKRGIVLDLGSDSGRGAFLRMVRDADVLIENYRPGTMERLGIGYGTLKAENPALVYCAVTGFGRTGPYAGRGGFDLITQGMSGLMSITGEAPGRPPGKSGAPVTDITAGILAAMGILAAYVHRLRTGEGQVVDTSLFEAGQHAGLSDSLIMQMAEIFGWDVDFALDIRAGDRFALVFEEQFKDGEKIGEGPIVAAEFSNRGRRIRAVRYVDPAGRIDYFSPDGRSMRKAFLRTPVNFTRISSRFSFSRRHPILHKMRAHRGVDYAAPRGTAVKASGDGRVVFAGRNGGYGRTIVLRNGSVYTTLYAHLSRFSKGIRPGKRVEQGQTIGYVGSTGLATGPHLHYEFRVRGAHRDPLSVKLPQAAPLAEGYMDDFRSRAEPLLAKLDLTARTAIATAN